MLLVGALFLVVFGPDKLSDVARDIGRFVNEARRSVEEFKDGFVSEDEAGRKPAKTGDPEVNRELERNLPREEAAVVIRTDPRNEQRQQQPDHVIRATPAYATRHHQVGQEIALCYQELGLERLADRRHKTPALPLPKLGLNLLSIVLPRLPRQRRTAREVGVARSRVPASSLL